MFDKNKKINYNKMEHIDYQDDNFLNLFLKKSKFH